MLEPLEPVHEDVAPARAEAPPVVAYEAVLGLQPPECLYTDAYRAMRTALMALCEREPFRRVLITSSQPAEGKSVVCLNLGSALARAQKQVLVIDADFRRPALHRLLDIPPGPGFVEACRGQAQPLAVIRRTNIEGLAVVPVGEELSDAADVASSPQTSVVLDQMDQGFDFVLIDSAPVLTYAASLQLATLADGVLLVARARGNAGYVRRALSSLQDVGARVLGIAVNDILPEDRAEHTVLYHYYSYGRETQGSPAP